MTRIVVCAYLFSTIFLWACEHETQQVIPFKDPTVTAGGVKIDLDTPGGAVVVSGNKLQVIDQGKRLNLEGNVSITMDDPASFKATAHQMTMDEDGQMFEMNGNVTAHFKIEDLDAN